jgi:hypothetical protein
MPQRISHNNKKEESFMSTLIKVLVSLTLLAGSFGAGYFVSNQGLRVVNSEGASVVASNAAQVVKDENARLQRDAVGKTEQELEVLLTKNHRTLFVSNRDGKPTERTTPRVFTNLTVEVTNGKVSKVLGWY